MRDERSLARRCRPPSASSARSSGGRLMVPAGFFLMLAVLAVPASAEEPLAWKLKQGAEFYVEETTRVVQTLHREGEASEHVSSQTTLTRYQVTSVRPDGQAEILMTLESVRAEGARDAERDLLRRMEGAAFRGILNAERRLVRFDGYGDFVRRVSAGDVALEGTVRALLPASVLRETVAGLFGLLPTGEEPFEPEEAWDGSVKVWLGPLGNVALERRLVAGEAEERDGRDQVPMAIEGSGTWEPPGRNGGSGPFRITGDDVTVKDVEGTAWFDPAAGRPTEIESRFRLQGSFAMQAGGGESVYGLEHVQTTRVRILGQKPAGGR